MALGVLLCGCVPASDLPPMMPAQPDTGWAGDGSTTGERGSTGREGPVDDATLESTGAVESDAPESSGDVASTGTSGEDERGVGSSCGGHDGRPAALEPIIPIPTGGCPTLQGGMPELVTFEADGVVRDAYIYSDPAAGGGGPLVFFFHGSGGNPQQAVATLGAQSVDEILAMGGVIVAPAPSGQAEIEWFLTTGLGDQDLRLMDEVVGCLHHDGPGIDPWQVHLVGFSAGALHSSQASFRRNAYVASIVGYSGGLAFPGVPQVEAWVPPAMLFHGGEDDVVLGFSFEYSTDAHAIAVGEAGGFCMSCDHQTGHDYPPNEVGVWRRADAINFLLDHRYGTEVSPYAVYGAPSWVPPYCETG